MMEVTNIDKLSNLQDHIKDVKSFIVQAFPSFQISEELKCHGPFQ